MILWSPHQPGGGCFYNGHPKATSVLIPSAAILPRNVGPASRNYDATTLLYIIRQKSNCYYYIIIILLLILLLLLFLLLLLRLGMALIKASNVVGNLVTLHRIWRILMVRRIGDLVLGTPGNRLCLWPLTNKQGSGVGHTLNASLALGWWPL
jgi:hypothetical protein